MEAATEKEVTALQVNDIVEHTSHYNSSRTDFYRIIEISKSGKKAFMVELPNIQTSGDWMNGEVMPNLEAIHQGRDLHEVMIKGTDWNGVQMLHGRINHTIREADGTVKWVNEGSLRNFYKWNGKPIWNNCD